MSSNTSGFVKGTLPDAQLVHVFSVCVCYQAVLLSSGLQTVVRCVGASLTAAAIPSPASAPATSTAGVRSVRTTASAPAVATATATLSSGTAPATKAGRCPPAPDPASAPRWGRWTPAATSWRAAASAREDSGGSGVLPYAAATCRRVTSGPVCVSVWRAGGGPAATGSVTATWRTAGAIPTRDSVCATRVTRVCHVTGPVELGATAAGATWGKSAITYKLKSFDTPYPKEAYFKYLLKYVIVYFHEFIYQVHWYV